MLSTIPLLLAVSAAFGPLADGPAPPTFAGEIASMVHANCTSCHRPNQSGPFSLITYEDVRKRAETLRAVIDDRYMPPWKAVGPHGQFANERRLTDAQIERFGAWVDAGCPEGDRSKTPEPPVYPDGWLLGEPDLVVRMQGRFDVPADGPDVYRSFVFPVALPEDKWVKAIELRPSARSAMHHALFFLDQTGEARRIDGRDGKAGIAGMNFLRAGGRATSGGARSAFSRGSVMGLGGYVPGTTPALLPGDLALPMPKGSDIIMQTHFHPSGKPETESAELALFFADAPPSKQIVPIQLPPMFGFAAGIDIPAGEPSFTIKDSFTLPVDVDAVNVGGHAHYICREMSMTATLPDGTHRVLLAIDDWDLDWQDRYTFTEPQRLPAGTVISVSITYDNSAGNPENPFSPPRRIRWGRESTDEMGSLTLMTVAADESERPRLTTAVRRKFTTSLLAGQRNRD